jgi:hypothetical protein
MPPVRAAFFYWNRKPTDDPNPAYKKWHEAVFNGNIVKRPIFSAYKIEPYSLIPTSLQTTFESMG